MLLKKKVSLFLFILLLNVSFVSLVLNYPIINNVNATSEFLSGYTERRENTISNASSALTSYQLRMFAGYGYLFNKYDRTALDAGGTESVSYGIIGDKLYWGQNYGGGVTGDIFKLDLLTDIVTTIHTGNTRAEWQGVIYGGKLYTVGEEKDGGAVFRASLHTTDGTTDVVTTVQVPNTNDCNELIAIDTDGTYLVAGERVKGGLTAGSSWPNGGGVWKIPIATVTNTATWTRMYEETNNWEWGFICYYNTKWYALLKSMTTTSAFKVISSTNLITWSLEQDYTGINLGRYSGASLVKGNNELILMAPKTSIGKFIIRTFDGSWSDEIDTTIAIPAGQSSDVFGIWMSSSSRLAFVIARVTDSQHNFYSMYLNGSDILTERTNLAGSFTGLKSDAVDYNGVKYYGCTATTGKLYKLYTRETEDVILFRKLVQADFDDVRFTDTNNAVYDYWLQESTASQYAIFWYEVDSIPAAPLTKSIYIYYSNALATSASSGTATFLLFDHFDGTSLNATLWSSTGGALVTVGSSLVSIMGGTGPATWSDITSKAAFGINMSFGVKFTALGGGSNLGQALQIIKTGAGTGNPWSIKNWYRQADTMETTKYYNQRYAGADASQTLTYTSTLVPDYGFWDVKYTKSSVKYDVADHNFYIEDDVLVTDNVYLQLGAWDSHIKKSQWDWAFVRNYINGVVQEISYGGDDVLNVDVTISNMEGCGNWLFAMNKFYNFTAEYYVMGTPEIMGISFSDGVSDITVVYNYTSGRTFITSGSDKIIIRSPTISNLGGGFYNVTFPIYLFSTIHDSYDRDISMYIEDTLGNGTGWEVVRVDYFNIYSLGGLTTTTITGSAGRLTGGDLFDLYAGGEYVPADILEENFESGSLSPQIWTAYEFLDENVANDVTIIDYPTYLGTTLTGSTRALKVYDAAAGTPAPYAKGVFNSAQSQNFTLTLWWRMNDNTSGYSTLFIDGQSSVFIGTLGAVRWGYGANFSALYVDDNGAPTATGLTHFYSNFWYNLTIIVDLTNSLYSVYVNDVCYASEWALNEVDIDVTDFRIESFNSGTARATYVDDMKAWRTWSGGTTGSAKSEILFRNLQHARILVHIDNVFEYSAEGWMLWTKTNYYPDIGSWYVGMDYCLDNGDWVDGWYAKVTPSAIFWDADNAWMEYNISWYYQEALIKTDTTLTLISKQGSSAFQYSVYIDLWFNKVNASSVIGGRINSEFWGMSQKAPWWSKWWSSNWQVQLSTTSQSMLFTNLMDAEGDMTSAPQVKMMKLWMMIDNTNGANPGYMSIHDYDIFNYQFAAKDMVGVDTPLVEATKIPNMPSSGFVPSIIAGFKSAIAELTSIFGRILEYAIQGADWLLSRFFGMLGIDLSLSTILGWLRTLFANMGTVMLTFFSSLTMIFLIITGPVVTFLSLTGTFIVSLLSFWGMFWAVLDGSSPYLGGIGAFLAEVPAEALVWMSTIFYVIWVLEVMETKGWAEGYATAAIPFKMLMAIFDIMYKVARWTIEMVDKILSWLMKSAQLGGEAIPG